MRDTSLRLARPASTAFRNTGVHRRQDSVMGQVLPAGAQAVVAPTSIVVAAAIAPAVRMPAPMVQVPHEHPLVLPQNPASRHAARVAVGAYRFAGLAILTLIVALLLAYISTTVFYFFSHSWVMPIAISPSDAKVVTINTELAARQNERDALAMQLKQADLDVAMHQRYQLAFVKTVRADLAHREYALAQLTALKGTATTASANVSGTINGFAAAQQAYMNKELEAGLIKQDDMMSGNFQQAEIKSQTLGLAEQQAGLEQRTSDLARETASLDAILDDKKQDQALAYDVLQIKQTYNQSKLALAQAMASRDQVKAAVAREDALIDTLKQSVYVKAIEDKAMIAYVPYDNMQNAKAGEPLYRCKAGMVWCHRVGQILAVLPGEVMFQHPHRDKQVRGQAVELQLAADEGESAQDDQLFVGSKPMMF